MDGIHDLGGMEGFGPVEVEPDEPVFHSEWERRAMGLTFAGMGLGIAGFGSFRYAVERMDPVHYLTSRYYEHWATALATRLVENGWTTPEELNQRAGGVFPISSHAVVPVEPDPESNKAEPRFKVGDEVHVRHVETRGHTRCPRYVRGRTGTVVRVDPPFPFPDAAAHSPDGAAHKEPVYCVRFALDGNTSVSIDLWESYLA